MENRSRIENLKEHIAKHPNDYQAVIGLLIANSDMIEHEIYLRKIERIKRVARFRREYEEQS